MKLCLFTMQRIRVFNVLNEDVSLPCYMPYVHDIQIIKSEKRSKISIVEKRWAMDYFGFNYVNKMQAKENFQ